MGFWHTGYMDMRDLGPAGIWALPDLPPVKLPPPSVRCGRCGERFADPEELERHTFRGHHSPRPILSFQGRECGVAPVIVPTRTEAGDWVVRNADIAWVNDREVPVDELGQVLAGQLDQTIDLRLYGGDVEAEFKLHFEVASDEDLIGVDRSLSRLASSQTLTARSIEEFIQACSPFTSAVGYYDGLSQYFFGVLAREGADDSGLERADYRDKYQYAAAELEGYDRLPARTVAGLVAFHLNQFPQAEVLASQSPRLAASAGRLRQFLTLDEPDVSQALPKGGGLDALFTDGITERILQWVGVAFDSSARHLVQTAEDYLDECVSFDRVKLQVVLAEYHLAAGSRDRARRHADDLLHNDLTSAWAKNVRARL